MGSSAELSMAAIKTWRDSTVAREEDPFAVKLTWVQMPVLLSSASGPISAT